MIKIKITNYITSTIIIILLSGCKINQTKNGLKTGKWITEKTFMNTTSKEIGKYKKGEKKGKWNYFYNNKLSKTEHYKNTICETISYHNTGKIREKGLLKKYTINSETEWLPYGQWEFYDSEGVFLSTKVYEKGIPIQEIYSKEITD